VALGRFPSWLVGGKGGYGSRLNAFSHAGCQLQDAGFTNWTVGSFRAGGGQQTMPTTLYNSGGRAVTLGPTKDFFVAVHDTATSGGLSLSAGPMASIERIAANYSFQTAIVGGASVGKSLSAFGRMLLKQAGKVPISAYEGSYVLSHLGYWVDNGATYYRPNAAAYAHTAGMEGCAAHHNCTYEAALLAVRNDAVKRAIPLRYIQWDDWGPLDWTWPVKLQFQQSSGILHFLERASHQPGKVV
jgi:hypothetical protein